MNESFSRVTIKDVAKACGVSATTVSLALRNHPSISEKTIARVKRAAGKLGYKRHPWVSALMSNIGASRGAVTPVMLAVVYNVPPAEAEKSPYHRELWKGISGRASQLGFCAERFFLHDKKIGSARRMTEILYARGIGGILIAPLAQAGGHLTMDWSRFSAVAIGYSMLRPPLHRVCPDQYQSIRLAMHQIRHCGYSRPGLIINGYSGLRTLHLWSSGFYGYEHASKSRGIIPVLEFGEVDRTLLLKWLKKHNPDVIISSGKEMAVWDALHRERIRVPEDLGFVSLSCNEQYPEISGVNENENRVGQAAVDQLVQQLYHNEKGVPQHPRVLQIAPDWQEGKTCVKQPLKSG